MVAALIWYGGIGIGRPHVTGMHIVVDDVRYHLRRSDQSEWQPGSEHPVLHTTSTIEFLGYEVNLSECRFDHIPYEDDAFVWVAGLYFDRFAGDTTHVVVLVRGEPVPVDRERLRPIDTAAMAGPIWCPVANMTAARPYGTGGAEIKRGSRHCSPGAKLYCFDAMWGDGYEKIKVVGHHRASHRFATMVVSSSWLTNWRVELAYSPHVIRELWPTWDGTPEKKAIAQEIVDEMRQRGAAATSEP